MDHLRRSLFLHLALLYGRLVPFPQRKWRICLWLLARGGIHPWQHREAWREAVAHLPSSVVRVRGIRMRCEWPRQRSANHFMLPEK